MWAMWTLYLLGVCFAVAFSCVLALGWLNTRVVWTGYAKGEVESFSKLAAGMVFKVEPGLVEWHGLVYGVKGDDGKVYVPERTRWYPGWVVRNFTCQEPKDPSISIEVVGMVKD